MVRLSFVGSRESLQGVDSSYFLDIPEAHVGESGHTPLTYRSDYQSVALQNDMDGVNDRSMGDRGFPERREDMYSD